VKTRHPDAAEFVGGKGGVLVISPREKIAVGDKKIKSYEDMDKMGKGGVALESGNCNRCRAQSRLQKRGPEERRRVVHQSLQ